jgi:hypothetical protein
MTTLQFSGSTRHDAHCKQTDNEQTFLYREYNNELFTNKCQVHNAHCKQTDKQTFVIVNTVQLLPNNVSRTIFFYY